MTLALILIDIDNFFFLRLVKGITPCLKYCMHKELEQSILRHTNSKRILNVEKIQSLWSDYGQIDRITLNNQSIIVKQICFPKVLNHPRGWNSDLAHKRKVKSYQVESNWYQEFNSNIKDACSPRFISYFELDKTLFLILEDLKDRAFKTKESISISEAKQCLKWLANFHCNYLNVKPKELWETGTYWHLDTRPDEFQEITDPKIKQIAPLVDKKLKEASFQTLVHGDAKLSNFLFNTSEVAAVDFQYVGKGVGVKDVAYFLTSIFSEDELFKYEQECLDFYFKELKSSLIKRAAKVDTSSLETQWRELYPLAAFDFYRFLKGWSPDHYKLNTYAEYIIKEVSKCY